MDGHIGVDESGKGDFFGPLVIAACYVGPEHLAELDGVKDSKKLTDAVATHLASRIKAVCPHSVIAIGPAKYNELYEKFRNLNKLLAWGHARAIENVLELAPCQLVISDQFADPAGLRRALFERGRQVELRSMVRAESDIAVAAASILARAEFLWKLRSLGEQYGVALPKGATSPVIDAGVRYVQAHGRDALKNVAKMHFKTAANVLAAAQR
ncbi:MAG: ribonuclease HIII [Fimbriimonadaceae bacterium]|nr:ribonuclease HIII [Chthonomonadaceae bacterium]MCO5295667.1 ribonuclease HIII [Fimbriimonadaceae bacterium]